MIRNSFFILINYSAPGSAARFYIVYSRRHTKRSVSLFRLTLLVGSGLPETKDKEKTTHTLEYSVSRSP